MFDIASTELLLIVIVAVVVIGPKDLPRAMYKVGQVINKARGMARHFRTGMDAMVREVELEELEKKWADQNRRIMAEHPPETSFPQEEGRMEPLPGSQAAAALPAAAQSAVRADADGSVQNGARPDAVDGPPYLVAQPNAHRSPDGDV